VLVTAGRAKLSSFLGRCLHITSVKSATFIINTYERLVVFNLWTSVARLIAVTTELRLLLLLLLVLSRSYKHYRY